MTDFHYSINASDLEYNMLSDYICSLNVDVLTLILIVPVSVIVVCIMNIVLDKVIQ